MPSLATSLHGTAIVDKSQIPSSCVGMPSKPVIARSSGTVMPSLRAVRQIRIAVSRVAQNPVTGYDVHATVLALLGVDHTSLTFRHNGVNRRLTDVHGHVLKQLIKQV